MSDIRTYDVIVVGAGVIGCSIAYHLTRAGLKTALLDQEQVGAGASGANFGMVQSNDAELVHSIPMVLASYRRYETLEEELGMPFGFRRIGALRLLSTEAQWKTSEERAGILSAAGIPYEFVPPERIREIEPMVDTSTLFGGTYASYQGQLNPFLLMWAYLRRAIPLGLALHTFTKVTGFDIESGRIRGVHTNRGHFSAGAVVLATAAWTRPLGKMIGQDWNIHTFRASAMVSEPVYGLKLNTIIATADHIEMEVTGKGDAELTVLALSQTADGHFLIAQADRPGEETNPAISHAAPKTMAMMAGRFFPALRGARLLRTWTAATTYTDDGCPLLGPVRAIEGLILAASYRSAIVHSPLAGEVVMRMLTTGCDDLLDISAFSPDREMGKSAETIYTVKSSHSGAMEENS
ncbi:MAG: FAD-binding oxidoreductase [Anaerolineaceae bacterium]|nr:FAD-binding oxidoreductase [Anaerolineaceae bacterium]